MAMNAHDRLRQIAALAKPKHRQYAAHRRPKHKRPADCEACGLTATVYVPLVYDHNHGTGEHRGWLCNGCNSALGFAGDNPEILDRLAGYLRTRGHHSERPAASLPPEPHQHNDSDATCQGARCN